MPTRPVAESLEKCNQQPTPPRLSPTAADEDDDEDEDHEEAVPEDASMDGRHGRKGKTPGQRIVGWREKSAYTGLWSEDATCSALPYALSLSRDSRPAAERYKTRSHLQVNPN